jgi:hypothetical protein
MRAIDTNDDALQEGQCYPADLAEFILPLLQAAQCKKSPHFQSARGFEMPTCETLKRIISCAYQASLQTDEQRPVTFRLILGASEAFLQDQVPHGLHCFKFSDTLPFTPYEIRKLSPAIAYHRSLIGIVVDEAQNIRIWGSVHSGPRWLKALQGGRINAPEMPPALVLRVSGPGRIEIAKGALAVGQLSEGRIFGPAMNVYMSKWLPEKYSKARSEILDVHLAARATANTEWADIDPNCLKILRQHITRRMLAAARAYRHGGIILWVPNEMREQVLAEGNPYIDLGYEFEPGDQRHRLRTMMVEILNTLAEIGARSNKRKRPVEWKDYETSVDPLINQLDEAIFELSHFVANLTAIDGAVVLTKEFELLGFGGEIHCSQHEVSTVARSIDLEADNVRLESIHQVGTRHRSVYRFCNAIRDAVGQVISQDGTVRFVTWHNNHVTYWDQQAIADAFE